MQQCLPALDCCPVCAGVQVKDALLRSVFCKMQDLMSLNYLTLSYAVVKRDSTICRARWGAPSPALAAMGEALAVMRPSYKISIQPSFSMAW